VRTSNLAERAFEEERRRTKVIPHLWDEGSVSKLVFAVLIRVSERWGKKGFSEFEQHQIRSLRRQRHLDEPTVLGSPITLMGKPPALPGDSQSLTVPGIPTSLRTVNRSPGHGKETDRERLPDPKSY
jgi:hypothetical protein